MLTNTKPQWWDYLNKLDPQPIQLQMGHNNTKDFVDDWSAKFAIAALSRWSPKDAVTLQKLGTFIDKYAWWSLCQSSFYEHITRLFGPNWKEGFEGLKNIKVNPLLLELENEWPAIQALLERTLPEQEKLSADMDAIGDDLEFDELQMRMTQILDQLQPVE